MNSQLLIGGRKIEETPQFRNALEEQQKIIRSQYEKRLQDLEKERQMIEEVCSVFSARGTQSYQDKAQVDRYKQLLLKQRDIMIALTTRLNERDETIIQLQEELDAYDRIHRETEEMLEGKAVRANQLERLLSENKISVPKDSTIEIQKEGNGESIKGSIGSKRLSQQQQHEGQKAGIGSDIVNYGDQETYNITKNNLLSAEEKIVELTHVADNQKTEIMRLRGELDAMQNSNDTAEFMKNEISVMQDKVKKAEENQTNLLEIIRKKGLLCH